MRKLLCMMAAMMALLAAVAPTFADEHTNCNDVPKSEWAKCIFDQAADQGSQ
jgi:hypothetical protein